MLHTVHCAVTSRGMNRGSGCLRHQLSGVDRVGVLVSGAHVGGTRPRLCLWPLPPERARILALIGCI
jgi:hypothetical protein